MRRAVTLTAIATLIMAGVVIKLIVTSGNTVASTETTTGSIETTMPIYELHIRHPDINRLPTNEIPQP